MEPTREGGRKLTRECTRARIYPQENAIISFACMLVDCSVYVHYIYYPSIVCVSLCVFAYVGPQKGSRLVHTMSGRASISLLMVQCVTTLPPSFLHLMSVT